MIDEDGRLAITLSVIAVGALITAASAAAIWAVNTPSFQRAWGSACSWFMGLRGSLNWMLPKSSPKVQNRVNLPSVRKLRKNKNHIMSGHSAGGNRGGPNKDRFPKWMTWSMISKAIDEAYTVGKKIQTQGDRVFIRGFSKTYNTVVEMWVNLKEKIIESAWPK